MDDALPTIGDVARRAGVATHVGAWKAIARRRLAVLDAEIARLQQARSYLEGALLCRYDHPATECRIMGEEIDRRLAPSATAGN